MPFLEAQVAGSKQLNYTELETQIKTTQSDSIRTIYANLYLNKAKKEKDRIKMAEGYDFLLEINTHSSLAVKYADSIIETTILLNNKKHLAEGYLKKGIQLYYLAKHSEALENYVTADTYFIKNNDVYNNIKVRHYIGLLKIAAQPDNNQEALELFKKNILFFNDEKNKVKHSKQYLKSLYALADSYIGNKKTDSALLISEIGIKESFKTKDDLYPYFLFSFGTASMDKEEFGLALDSLIKGSNLIKNKKKSLCNSYFLISSAYEKLDSIDLSIKYLEKIDSTFEKEPQVIVQAKEANEAKFRLYKKTNNNEEKIKIVDRLLSIDSVLKLNYQDLGGQIVKQYEVPQLLSEKQKLILKLEEKSKRRKSNIFILSSLILVIIIVVFFLYGKNIIYKKRFEELLKEYDRKQKNDDSNDNLIETKTKIINTPGIPEELVKSISVKLDDYENSNMFLSAKTNLNSLAKEFDTNSSYLSKVINYTKGVNFANYLNNLKVDYAINKLKVDKQFRSYTIKAIAEEVGFNNAQSFTNAFSKKTGLFPSYFIKQLNKKK